MEQVQGRIKALGSILSGEIGGRRESMRVMGEMEGWREVQKIEERVRGAV